MRKGITFLLLLLIIYLPVTAVAEMALVPNSGQALCYDAAGGEIPCVGTGQDGELQMGVHWPTPRFTNNGNGTITDNLTGLVWLRNANCYGDYSWLNAVAWVNTLANGTCGLTDGSVAGNWRLPNRNELMSLVNRQQTNPASWLNTVGFSVVDNAGYWTSSSVNTDNAWSLTFYDGRISSYPKSFWNSWRVWPVRGGQ